MPQMGTALPAMYLDSGHDACVMLPAHTKLLITHTLAPLRVGKSTFRAMDFSSPSPTVSTVLPLAPNLVP